MAEYSAIYFVTIRVPFRVFQNSYSRLMWSFKPLLSPMRFVVEVITLGGVYLVFWEPPLPVV
jgi:hypothetical protein